MTNQEKKAWLLQYRQLCDRIDRLKKKKARLLEQVTKMSAPSDGTPYGSGVSDTVGFAVSKAADLQSEIDRETARRVDLKREVKAVIHTVDDLVLQELLEQRYIDRLRWEEIAEVMSRDIRWVFRLHGKALSKLTIKSQY